MKARIAALPTILTLGNAFSGFIAIGYVAKAQSLSGPATAPDTGQFGVLMERAGWLVLLALVFDALDGKVARIVNGESDFGVQLDSLADAISFGVAPAMMVMAMAQQQEFLRRVAWGASCLFVGCALLRLARYNVESARRGATCEYFIGLPSPAAAGTVVSLVMVRYHVLGVSEELPLVRENVVLPVMETVAHFLPVVMVVLAIMMVSRLKYVHLLNKYLKDQEGFGYLVILLIVGLFFFFTRPFSIPLAFLIYLAWGLLVEARQLLLRRRESSTTPPGSTTV